MTRQSLLLVALATSGCLRTSNDVQPGQLGNLHFNAPLHWTHTDSNARSQPTSVWVPEDNPNKESVEIVRAKLGPGLSDHDLPGLESALEHAQIGLPEVRVGSPTSFLTARGRMAVMVPVDFVPHGASQRYRRLHAMVVDGKSLIHVLYTAAVADDSASAFQTVLQSIYSEGA
jgi:hypothetical protein